MADLPSRTAETLLVVGAAPGTRGAVDRALPLLRARYGGVDVAAVNAGGLVYDGPLKLWASYHFPHLVHASAVRRRANFPMDDITYVLDVPAPGLNAVQIAAPHNGGSGMLAAWAGVLMDYPHIVLAGIELSDPLYTQFRAGWEEFAAGPEAWRVTSLSGWTADLLGRPNI